MRQTRLTAKGIRQGEQGTISRPGEFYNLELLTALRRVQKRPDPLKIMVDAPSPIIVTLPALPLLKVRIQNVDHEQHSAGFTFGGDYRSGRQARWRVVLTDSGGQDVPSRIRSGFRIGGGIHTTGMLRYGEAWETTLDIREFVQTPAPGSYELKVLYHNRQCIAHEQTIGGLIVSTSEPVRIVVNPLSLRCLTDEERMSVEKLVVDLSDKGPVSILAGTYGEWAHDFIAPETPAGAILSKGTIVVPVLLDALNTAELTPGQRAWIFAILFSLTGDHDPLLEDNVVGPYKCRESGWQVWGGLVGGQPSGGIGISAHSSSRGGRIDPEAQAEFIKKWQSWRRNFQLITADDT